MIKDSKLIGTKIAAPFGWKKFKVGELFDCKSIRQIPTGLDLDSVGDIPYVSQTSINNSITHYVTEKSCLELNKGHSIVLGVDTQWATYQEFDFYANKMISLYLKSSFNRVLTSLLGLYMCSVLNKNFTIYDYNRKLSFHKLVVTVIDLPIMSSDQPDFAWMEQYMKLVQEDYLKQKELSNQAEIKAYLTEGHTDSLAITDTDRQFLRDFEKLPRREFKVGKLFEKLSSKYLSTGNKFEHVYKTCTINHNIPMLYAKYDNNGIMYWSKYGEFETHKNCIGIIYNGAVSAGCVFAQEQSTGVLAESYLIKFSTQDVPFKVNLYFSSVLRKILSQKYSREYLATWNKVIDDELELPVLPDSQVDVASIEKYMQIQVKLTMAKRKSYLDHELELMKQII